MANWKFDFSKGLTLTLGVSVALLAVGLYFRDIEREGNESADSEPIGLVVESAKDVSRRPKERLLWSELPTDRRVFRHDTIRTGKNSTTLIRLSSPKTGEAVSEIRLGPDSLVVLETDQEGLRVHVAAGELFIKGEVRARVGNALIHARNSVHVRQNSLSGKFEVHAQKGAVEIVTDKGRTQLKEGSELTQSDTGKLKVETFAFNKIFPSENASLELKKTGELIPFKLEANADAPPPPWHLQVSTTPEFKELVRDFDLVSIDKPFEKSLPPGSYYWRIFSVAADKGLSSVGRFEVWNPPELVWTRTLPLKARFTNTGMELGLAWKPVRKAVRYDLSFKIGNDEREKASTADTSLEWKDTKGSLWTLLQKSDDASLEKGSVELSAFDAEDAQLASKLVSPLSFDDDRHPEKFEFARAQTKEDLRDSELSWKAAGAIKILELEVGSSTKSLKTDHFALKTRELYHLVESGKAPRIRIIPPSGKAGEWQSFEIDRDKISIAGLSEKAPKTVLPHDENKFLKRFTSEIQFKWRSELNGLYQPLSWDLVIDGPKTHNESLTQPNYRIEHPAVGKYTWKVRSVWKDFGPGPYSSEQTFFVTEGAKLKAPTLRMPASMQNNNED